MIRNDGRGPADLRPITITRSFTRAPAGSVLWQQGGTVLLVTASVTAGAPPWFKPDRPGGWVTAEYVMLPASTPVRKDWPKIGHTDSRGTEIQRLIGRSLRAAVDLSRIGPHTITLDCQVLQADGGTRTAAISAAYVALADAITKLPPDCPAPRGLPPGAPNPHAAAYAPGRALTAQLAAVSVGIVDGQVLLDRDYHDDSRAEVDLNVAYTTEGKFVEVQGSAEAGRNFDRRQLDAMLDTATDGCRRIFELQREALARPRE